MASLQATLTIAFAAALACTGCATPSERFRARLEVVGLVPAIVRGDGYDHLVVSKPGIASGPVHVYIEGDGLPFVTPEQPSDDPTPRAPLVLELMLRDPHSALYLGRPCYFGVGGRECNAAAWTDGRYSEAVVASMASALGRALGHDRRIRLIGHSGGGVLATLLSHRLPDVDVVLTIGANLDVAAWTALHRYTPLAGSLDPAALPAATVRERHLVGSEDRNVPPALLQRYARGRRHVEVIEWPRFDHVCCWVEAWPDVLAKLQR